MMGIFQMLGQILETLIANQSQVQTTHARDSNQLDNSTIFMRIKGT